MSGMAEEERKAELIESALKVFRLSPSFTKRDEKQVKKILKKLELDDLTYLANLFEEVYDAVARRGEQQG